MRVIVPSLDGMSPGVVLGYSSLKEAGGYSLDEIKTVHRLATDEEIKAAHAELEASRAREAKSAQSWLNMARRAAGLPTRGRGRATPPPGFPEIPPIDGTADPRVASQYGSTWWRAYKLAKQTGRGDEEVERFKEIGRYWFNIGSSSR